MRVQFRTLSAGPAGIHHAGTIHDIDDALARQLMVGGYVFAVDAHGRLVGTLPPMPKTMTSPAPALPPAALPPAAVPPPPPAPTDETEAGEERDEEGAAETPEEKLPEAETAAKDPGGKPPARKKR